MSAAQEEEIRRLAGLLQAAVTERNAAVLRADRLQVELFETRLKARQAIENCKRDAIEVAVEEAVREHLQNTSILDELTRRSVDQISTDKSMIMGVKSTLLELRSQSERHRASRGAVTADDVARFVYDAMRLPQVSFFLEESSAGAPDEGIDGEFCRDQHAETAAISIGSRHSAASASSERSAMLPLVPRPGPLPETPPRSERAALAEDNAHSVAMPSSDRTDRRDESAEVSSPVKDRRDESAEVSSPVKSGWI